MTAWIQGSLSAPVAFDLVAGDVADRLLEEWGHYLGACRRPFGRQDFALLLEGEPVGIATSASTVSATLAGGLYRRGEVIELARLCSRPDAADLTRVTLRLWRRLAPKLWPHWSAPARALVAYSDASRHRGDIYRFDGWKRFGTNPGSSGGGTWTKPRTRTPKTLWLYEVAPGT